MDTLNNNPIAALLNNPLQKSQPTYKIPKTLLPNVPQTILPKIKPTDFQQYINEISPAFEPYRRNRAIGLSAVIQGIPSITRNTPQETLSTSYTNLWELTHKNYSKTASSAPSSSLASNEADPSTQYTHALQPPTNAEPLETVPTVFFDPDFNLENPRTFDTVVEQMNIVDSSKRENQVGATNSLLQEKLSHYLDTVEVHLIREVSRRSSSFFAALSTLQDLHKETLCCVEQIHSLRSNLARVNATQTKPGLNVVRLQRRRANLARIYSGAQMIAEIRLTQPTIQILLGQGDFVGALDLIAEANHLLKGAQQHKPKSHPERKDLRPENLDKPRNSVDLRGVRALLHLGGQLRELHRMIEVMMENELVNVLVADLTEFVAQLPSPTEKIAIVGSLAGTDVSSHASAQMDPIRERITPLLLGLLRTDRLPSALQAYRQVLMREVKNAIKKRYPPVSQSLLAEDANAVGKKKDTRFVLSILARQLRAMTFDNFFSLLVSVYSVLLNLMRRISAIHNLFSSLLQDAEARGVLPGSDSVTAIGFGDPPPSQSWQFPSLQALQKPPSAESDIEEEDELGSVAVPTRDAKPLPAAPSGGGSSSMLSNTGRKSTSDGSAYGQLISESSEICFAAADLAHVRCAKLVGVRADQNAQLNAKDFYRLFASTWEFVVQGEEMCGQMCFGLRGTMLSQAKSFLNHFHMERMKQLSLLIENEQWTQAEVPVDFQLIVDRICASGKTGSLAILCEEHQFSSPTTPTTSIPEGLNDDIQSKEIPNNFSRASSFSQPSQTSPATAFIRHSNSLSSITSNASRESGNSTRQLYISQYSKDPRRAAMQLGYHAVGCSLLLVKMLEEYLICVAKVQAITTDAVGRLVEILRLFNSKTCQSVLGAGAMRSAGLKNITAKHIALAAQTLGLMMALIPHVRECMNANMTAKQAVMLSEFDRMLRDFVEHQNELYLKLVSIMNDRLAIHCRSMQATNWDVPDPKQPPGAPSAWMELLVKESTTLHKVLGKYLPVEALKFVMSNVFTSYAKKLEDEVQKVDVFTGAGKNRLLFDIQYYVRKLNDLEHVEGPGNNLEVAVNNLKIKEKSARLSGLGGSRRPSSEETRGIRTTPIPIVATPGDQPSSSRTSLSSLAPQQPASSPPGLVNHATTPLTPDFNHPPNTNSPSVGPPSVSAPAPATGTVTPQPVPASSAPPASRPSNTAGWSQRMVNMMNAKTKHANPNAAGSHENLTDNNAASSAFFPSRRSMENPPVVARNSLDNPSRPTTPSSTGKPPPYSAPQLQTPPKSSVPTPPAEIGTAVASFLSGATSGLAAGMGRSAISNEAARKKLTEASSYLGKMFHRKDAAPTPSVPSASTHVPSTPSLATHPMIETTRLEGAENPSTESNTSVPAVLQPSALPLKQPSHSLNNTSQVPVPNIPTNLPPRPSLDAAFGSHLTTIQSPMEPLSPRNVDQAPVSEFTPAVRADLPITDNREESQANTVPSPSLAASDGSSEENTREREPSSEHDDVAEERVDRDGEIVLTIGTGYSGSEVSSKDEIPMKADADEGNRTDPTSNARENGPSQADLRHRQVETNFGEEIDEAAVKRQRESPPDPNGPQSVVNVPSGPERDMSIEAGTPIEKGAESKTGSKHPFVPIDVENGLRILSSNESADFPNTFLQEPFALEAEKKADTEMETYATNAEATNEQHPSADELVLKQTIDTETSTGFDVRTVTTAVSPEREDAPEPNDDVSERQEREKSA